MLRRAVAPQAHVLVAPVVAVSPLGAVVHASLPVGRHPAGGGAVVVAGPGAHAAGPRLGAPGVGVAPTQAGVAAGLAEHGVRATGTTSDVDLWLGCRRCC